MISPDRPIESHIFSSESFTEIAVVVWPQSIRLFPSDSIYRVKGMWGIATVQGLPVVVTGCPRVRDKRDQSNWWISAPSNPAVAGRAYSFDERVHMIYVLGHGYRPRKIASSVQAFREVFSLSTVVKRYQGLQEMLVKNPKFGSAFRESLHIVFDEEREKILDSVIQLS